MFLELPKDWKSFLLEEVKKPYFIDLQTQLEQEYNSKECFPPKELIFEALKQCAFEDIKVVIIGQDPYHGENEANGLAFSVNDGVRFPPSLKNIYKEILLDFDTVFLPSTGNLIPWAKQGVLLLNTTLTVQKNNPNSHKHLKWNLFTDAIIEKISNEKENVVFLLWGMFAQKKGLLIDRTKHLVLECGHPSPMSANMGKWFGNNHFIKTNKFLIKHKKTPIQWL